MLINTNISWLTAFLGGVAAFISPCVLPLVPAWLAFITGLGYDQLRGEEGHISGARRIKLVFVPTLFFVLGFSLVYSLTGLTASALGNALFDHSDWLRRLSAVLIIFFGLYLTGLVPLKFLNIERRLNLKKKPAHLGGAFLVGMAFAAGWVPCVGGILAPILTLAGNQNHAWAGFWLLFVFSMGLGLPFLLISLFVGPALRFLNSIKKITPYLNMVFGFMMIALGIIFLVWPKLFF